MAFDVGGISAWTDEISDRAQILLTPILGAPSAQYFDKYKDITGNTIKLPRLENTPYAQAGTACGFTSSGTTTITQLSLTTSAIKVQEKLCLQDLETYFTKAWLKSGSSPETAEIMDIVLKRKLAQVSKKLEQQAWAGKTTYTNDTFWKQLNGLIHQVDNAGDEIITSGGGAGTALTTANIRTVVEQMIFGDTPSAIADQELDLFMGYNHYNVLRQKLWQDNLFHYIPNSSEASSFSFKYPTSNVNIIAVPGLNNDLSPDAGGVQPTLTKNRMFLTYRGNFAQGFAAENDVNAFDVWYSKDNQELRMNMRFHIGYGIKDTNLVVAY